MKKRRFVIHGHSLDDETRNPSLCATAQNISCLNVRYIFVKSNIYEILYSSILSLLKNLTFAYFYLIQRRYYI